MKKLKHSLLILTAAGLLAACGSPTPSSSHATGLSSSSTRTDTIAPMISGVKATASVEAGKSYNLMAGVTAVDDIDGDLTNKIQVSIDPELPITNGVVTPGVNDTGSYDIHYSVKDSAGNQKDAYTELTVTEAFGEKELVHDYSFDVDTQGWSPEIVEGVTGTHGVVKGKYQFDITAADGVDWHVKYPYYNYPVEAGHSYTVKAKFFASKVGKMKILGLAKDVKQGFNEVSATYDSKVDAATNFELQFGEMAASGAFKIDIESIEVIDSERTIDEEKTEELELSSTGEITEGWAFNKDNWHCEYSAGNGVSGNIEKTETQAVVTQVSSGPSWAGKLIVQTKNKLPAGKKYTVKATYECSADASGIEFGYGTWDDDFKGLHEEYNIELKAGVAKTMEFTCEPTEEWDNPMLCLKMGTVPAGATVKVTDFHVTYEGDPVDIDFSREGFAEAWSETGRNAIKLATKTSFTTVLTGDAQDPFKASTDIHLNGVGLEGTKSYRVSLDLTATKKVEKVQYMLGNVDWDPNSCFDSGETITLEANETKHVVAIFSPGENLGNVKARIKYGAAVNETEVTVANLKIESIEFVEADPTPVLDPEWAFNATEWNCEYPVAEDQTVAGTIAKTAENAVVTQTSSGPSWAGKLIVQTKTNLPAGKKYRVKADYVCSADATGLELGYGDWADDFKALYAAYELRFEAGVKRTLQFECTPDKDWENAMLCLKMGTVPAGATMTVSNFSVEEVPASESVTSERFNFLPADIEAYANTEGGAASELYVENGELIYNITALSHESDWYNKLTISDLVLGGGDRYIIEIVAKADKALSGSLILNKSGDWDPRATNAFELSTEYKTFTLETDVMVAPLKFEVLMQAMHVNTSVDAVKITFKSIKLYSQSPIVAE